MLGKYHIIGVITANCICVCVYVCSFGCPMQRWTPGDSIMQSVASLLLSS